jgi:glycosyltransferase involved in cell wall biosynthesis
VTFHGQCNHDRVFALLSDCDVFCLPSAPEAFGVAYLEAMACGLLTIGVSGQGPSSFIEDGRTGLLVGERDVESLAGKLRAVIQNPAQYASMAAAGRDHVWQTLTWRNHAQAMTTVFADALQRRAAAN